jgi:serine/threonine protein kinase
VYKVQNILDEKFYAVKKIKKKVKEIKDKFDEELAIIAREARYLAKFNHPNIIRYYSSWIEANER